ncbi:uncharacterized protein LOC111388331 [Olea europaea var. sylvestris]|uniref:uncharacterized protein LOC111388331 n=1 Tax=Olea europaea var. sylvestris TaxID=158386 RepID=UPI000C1D6D4E|nr:uncharacterized protein LOC111388331 [Olea europaea var. sylvestris]
MVPFVLFPCVRPCMEETYFFISVPFASLVRGNSRVFPTSNENPGLKQRSRLLFQGSVLVMKDLKSSYIWIPLRQNCMTKTNLSESIHTSTNEDLFFYVKAVK